MQRNSTSSSTDRQRFSRISDRFPRGSYSDFVLSDDCRLLRPEVAEAVLRATGSLRPLLLLQDLVRISAEINVSNQQGFVPLVLDRLALESRWHPHTLKFLLRELARGRIVEVQTDAYGPRGKKVRWVHVSIERLANILNEQSPIRWERS